MKKVVLNHFMKIFLLGLFIFTIASCSFDSQQVSIHTEEKQAQVSDEIILGEAIRNPFAIRTNRKVINEEPNYYYFRIRTVSWKETNTSNLFVVI